MRRAGSILMAVLLAPAGAGAQQASSAAEVPSVTVSATGTIRRAPDQAMVSLAVENTAKDARTAAQQNAQQMAAVIRAVKASGIPANRIRTVGYNIGPQYEYTQPTPTRPGSQKLVGYRATNTVQVQVDSVARVGLIVDTAIAAGANRATGVDFQFRDPDAVRREALRQAVATARADAQAVAEAADQHVGSLMQITTGSSITPPQPMLMRAKSFQAEEATTPVEPGEIEVTANVTAVYRLVPGSGQP